SRLAEFDGLFIRETTGIDNHTYRFAKKAEAEGLMVIDDPESILKCTNKVYLADLLSKNKVPTPLTRILSKDRKEDLTDIAEALGFPLVLKIPDGSFSRGVVKVSDPSAFKTAANDLFKRSSLLLAQEYMYTDFDWRIGVLGGKPIFACQYFMTAGHWQIYNHKDGGEVESGGFQTMAVHEAPKAVVQAAVRAANLIGNGLYGVDLKQSGKRAVVIEVNDNPNVDSGVEDKFLGTDLYTLIMEDFLQRMEKRGRS
ncbi:MAG: RimK family alpha-L-glutamate ligase, partial [Natronospirillum sp.]